MANAPGRDWLALCRSIVTKNILLFLVIFLVGVVPLALRYYQDSRDYEIQVLASKLEFFAERGVSWLDAEGIHSLRAPADMGRRDYRDLVDALTRIETEFGVDNAVVMRRVPDGSYVYIAVGRRTLAGAGGTAAAANPCSPGAAGNPCAAGAAANPCAPAAAGNPCAAGGGKGIFRLGMPVHIHPIWPATYRATEDTWQAGRMMHSRLFGGMAGGQTFEQFLQINNPVVLGGRVVAILMLNKFARPVADAVREKTLMVFGLTVAVVLVGLVLFGAASARMLRPMQGLTDAAAEVSQGNLDVVIPPARSRDEVGRLSDTFATMLEGLRQRDFIRDTFGRYISQEVVDELLTSPDGLKLGGELREVTFLVSDLRGFTALSERRSPQEVVQIINRYLGRMVETISRFGGTVDEFQGDGILAFFGAPIAAADDPERAVACAVEMQIALEEINAEHRRAGLPELHMGIGINTGEVIVGNIGSEKRTKYGAMGSAVNMAYRIESNTVSGQVLISPSTYAKVAGAVRVAHSEDLRFKGIEEPVTVHEVAGVEGRYACRLPERAPEELTALPSPLAVTCFAVEGKKVSGAPLPGRILRLGARSAQAELEAEVPPSANLMLRLGAADADLSDVYAKVVSCDRLAGAAGGAAVCLSFTSLPGDAKAFLERERAAAAL